MVQDETVSILEESFVRIHKAITRGINIGISRGEGFEKNGVPGDEEKRGYLLYIQSLTIVLTAHHLGEDEVAFPEIKKKLPDGPFVRLKSDHIKIEAQLISLSNLSTNPELDLNQGEIKKIINGLKIISAVWVPHIGVEERSFSRSVLASLMNSEDQTDLAAMLSKHSQEHSVPQFLALPFVLYNLSGSDRAAILDTLPKEVIEELIPLAWKSKWSPMKPFLLD